MPQIIPIKDLRNTTEISRICHENDEPIFVTKNGYGDMVLMSMETYERSIARAELLSKIAEGEEDVRKGNLLDSDSVFRSLREELEDIRLYDEAKQETGEALPFEQAVRELEQDEGR